jgi:hypothetical protein
MPSTVEPLMKFRSPTGAGAAEGCFRLACRPAKAEAALAAALSPTRLS